LPMHKRLVDGAAGILHRLEIFSFWGNAGPPGIATHNPRKTSIVTFA
jgi:hypothetical protein